MAEERWMDETGSSCCCDQLSDSDDPYDESSDDLDDDLEVAAAPSVSLAGDDDDDDDGTAKGLLSRCWKCLTDCYGGFQRKVKALVEHKYFQQALLGAILVNTLSMGIEYHNQVTRPSFFSFFFLFNLFFVARGAHPNGRV